MCLTQPFPRAMGTLTLLGLFVSARASTFTSMEENVPISFCICNSLLPLKLMGQTRHVGCSMLTVKHPWSSNIRGGVECTWSFSLSVSLSHMLGKALVCLWACSAQHHCWEWDDAVWKELHVCALVRPQNFQPMAGKLGKKQYLWDSDLPLTLVLKMPSTFCHFAWKQYDAVHIKRLWLLYLISGSAIPLLPCYVSFSDLMAEKLQDIPCTELNLCDKSILSERSCNLSHDIL